MLTVTDALATDTTEKAFVVYDFSNVAVAPAVPAFTQPQFKINPPGNIKWPFVLALLLNDVELRTVLTDPLPIVSTAAVEFQDKLASPPNDPELLN